MAEYRDVTFADDGTVLGEHDQYGRVLNFEADLDLLWIRWANDVSREAIEEIWEAQDGYGPVGFTPPQGWDWSGIRDSTPTARRVMLAIARRYLPDAQVADRLGVDVPTLRGVLANAYDSR